MTRERPRLTLEPLHWARDEEEVRKSVPKRVWKIIKRHEKAVYAKLAFVEKVLGELGGLDETGKLIHETSLRLKRQGCTMYRDDGNTQCSGVEYTIVWIHELLPKTSPGQWRNDFLNWYEGRLECAIAHSLEVKIRAYDRRIEDGGWSLHFGGRKLDYDVRDTNSRITYGNGHRGAPQMAPLIQESHLAKLVSKILEMRQVLKLYSLVEKFSPPERRSRFGRDHDPDDLTDEDCAPGDDEKIVPELAECPTCGELYEPGPEMNGHRCERVKAERYQARLHREDPDRHLDLRP